MHNRWVFWTHRGNLAIGKPLPSQRENVLGLYLREYILPVCFSTFLWAGQVDWKQYPQTLGCKPWSVMQCVCTQQSLTGKCVCVCVCVWVFSRVNRGGRGSLLVILLNTSKFTWSIWVAFFFFFKLLRSMRMGYFIIGDLKILTPPKRFLKKYYKLKSLLEIQTCSRLLQLLNVSQQCRVCSSVSPSTFGVIVQRTIQCRRVTCTALPPRLCLVPTSRINLYSYDKIEKNFFSSV